MKLLDRYIGIAVASSIGLVLLVLLSLDSFFRLVRELNEVGEGNYTYLEMLLYLVLTTPYRIVEFFPVAALLGAIIGLGTLASHSELVVMRAAGVSILRVAGSVMKTGLLFIIAVMLLSEYVVPGAEQFAESRRTQMLAEQTALKTDNGFWSRDKRSFLNIRDVSPTGEVGDITIFEFDEQHRLRSSTHANKAVYENGQWVLRDITQSDISVKGIKIQTFEGAQWDSILSPALLNIVLIDPLRISMRDLYSYSTYLRDNGQDASRYELALWARLLMPVAIGVMLLLAVPFVFGPLRSVTIGQRILVGFLVGLAFFLINQAFNYLGLVYHIPPLLSAALPAGVFFVLALFMLRRV
jgi:lipopolysaccharide export system permease protein